VRLLKAAAEEEPQTQRRWQHRATGAVLRLLHEANGGC
jgi:hypothetical protein